MDDYRQFRITEEDVDDLRDHIRDESVIASYTRWVERMPELDSLVHRIEDAFRYVTLGDGIGMLEANGRDDYAGDAELARLRKLDCRTDWRSIAPDKLIQSAPSFMDAKGFLFHFPAYLIAELNDQFNGSFIYRLYKNEPFPPGWIDLLNDAQRSAVSAALALIAQHPDYFDDAREIDSAIRRLGETAG